MLNETAFDGASDGLVVVDGGGRVVRCNTAAADLAGLSAEQAEGRAAAGVFRDPSGSPLEFDGGSSRVTLRGPPGAGAVSVWCTVMPISAKNCEHGTSLVVFHGLADLYAAKPAEAKAAAAETEALRAGYRTQREMVVALQRAIVPSAPQTEHLDIGVAYAPAYESPAGGDNYDALVLPDGSVHVAVVDAMGKGLPATRAALEVSHALRVLALTGTPLDDLVERAAEIMAVSADDDFVATVLVARYLPDEGVLRVAGGGHPPALLIPAGGAVSSVLAPGTPIGMPGARSYGVADVPLAPGDTVVLYTDGIVEGFSGDVAEGMALLAGDLTRNRAMSPAELAEAVTSDAHRRSKRPDDLLAVVVRRRHADLP